MVDTGGTARQGSDHLTRRACPPVRDGKALGPVRWSRSRTGTVGATLTVGGMTERTDERTDAYALTVVDLPVWVPDWVHECCGAARRVGETVDLELTFAGDTVPAAGPDSVEVLDNGRVSVVGEVTGPGGVAEGNHTRGTRIASGHMKFGLAGDVPAARVRCTGELEEIRHGFPSDVTRALLTAIQWRPAIKRRLDAVSSVIDGYEPGERLASTEDRRRDDADSWAFLLTLRLGP
jgi:hypothetical protein